MFQKHAQTNRGQHVETCSMSNMFQHVPCSFAAIFYRSPLVSCHWLWMCCDCGGQWAAILSICCKTILLTGAGNNTMEKMKNDQHERLLRPDSNSNISQGYRIEMCQRWETDKERNNSIRVYINFTKTFFCLCRVSFVRVDRTQYTI